MVLNILLIHHFCCFLQSLPKGEPIGGHLFEQVAASSINMRPIGFDAQASLAKILTHPVEGSAKVGCWHLVARASVALGDGVCFEAS